MYEAYRVTKKFNWDYFIYAPKGACVDGGGNHCPCEEAQNVIVEDERGNTVAVNERDKCTGRVATGCTCPDNGYCSCSIDPKRYGGDIWLVEERHPRKDAIIASRRVRVDYSLSGDDLAQGADFQRLLQGEPISEPLILVQV